MGATTKKEKKTNKRENIEPILSTSEAFMGALSLMSKACTVPLANLTSMNAPPPMPLEAGLTTPKQRATATDASTA